MCLKLHYHRTNCLTQDIVHLVRAPPQFNYDIYHPLAAPVSCRHTADFEEGQGHCEQHGSCCTCTVSVVCDRHVGYGWFFCLGEIEAHVTVSEARANEIDVSLRMETIPQPENVPRMNIIGVAEAHRTLGDYMDFGAQVREILEQLKLEYPLPVPPGSRREAIRREDPVLLRSWEGALQDWNNVSLGLFDVIDPRIKPDLETCYRNSANPVWYRIFKVPGFEGDLPSADGYDLDPPGETAAPKAPSASFFSFTFDQPSRDRTEEVNRPVSPRGTPMDDYTDEAPLPSVRGLIADVDHGNLDYGHRYINNDCLFRPALDLSNFGPPDPVPEGIPHPIEAPIAVPAPLNPFYQGQAGIRIDPQQYRGNNSHHTIGYILNPAPRGTTSPRSLGVCGSNRPNFWRQIDRSGTLQNLDSGPVNPPRALSPTFSVSSPAVSSEARHHLPAGDSLAPGESPTPYASASHDPRSSSLHTPGEPMDIDPAGQDDVHLPLETQHVGESIIIDPVESQGGIDGPSQQSGSHPNPAHPIQRTSRSSGGSKRRRSSSLSPVPREWKLRKLSNELRKMGSSVVGPKRLYRPPDSPPI